MTLGHTSSFPAYPHSIAYLPILSAIPVGGHPYFLFGWPQDFEAGLLGYHGPVKSCEAAEVTEQHREDREYREETDIASSKPCGG